MLTEIINPDGESRIMKIIDALPYFGVDIRRPGFLPEMTAEEKHRRGRERRRQQWREWRERQEAER